MIGFSKAAVINGTLPDFPGACAEMANTLKTGTEFENVTVNFATYVSAGTNLSLPIGMLDCIDIWKLGSHWGTGYNLSTCYSADSDAYQVVSKDICRIAMQVTTSNRSGKFHHFIALLNVTTN